MTHKDNRLFIIYAFCCVEIVPLTVRNATGVSEKAILVAKIAGLIWFQHYTRVARLITLMALVSRVATRDEHTARGQQMPNEVGSQRKSQEYY